jgi:hypothetical protein
VASNDLFEIPNLLFGYLDALEKAAHKIGTGALEEPAVNVTDEAFKRLVLFAGRGVIKGPSDGWIGPLTNEIK